MSSEGQALRPTDENCGQISGCPDGSPRLCYTPSCAGGEAVAAIQMPSFNAVACLEIDRIWDYSAACNCPSYGYRRRPDNDGYLGGTSFGYLCAVDDCNPTQFQDITWLVDNAYTSAGTFTIVDAFGSYSARAHVELLSAPKLFVWLQRPSDPSIQSCAVHGGATVRIIYGAGTELYYDCEYHYGGQSQCCAPQQSVGRIVSHPTASADYIAVPWSGDPDSDGCRNASANDLPVATKRSLRAAHSGSVVGYVRFDAVLPYRPTDNEMANVRTLGNLFKAAWAPYWNASGARLSFNLFGETFQGIDDLYYNRGQGERVYSALRAIDHPALTCSSGALVGPLETVPYTFYPYGREGTNVTCCNFGNNDPIVGTYQRQARIVQSTL